MFYNTMILYRMRAHIGTLPYVFNALWCKVGAMNLIVAGYYYYCFYYWKSARLYPDFALCGGFLPPNVHALVA